MPHPDSGTEAPAGEHDGKIATSDRTISIEVSGDTGLPPSGEKIGEIGAIDHPVAVQISGTVALIGEPIPITIDLDLHDECGRNEVPTVSGLHILEIDEPDTTRGGAEMA